MWWLFPRYKSPRAVESSHLPTALPRPHGSSIRLGPAKSEIGVNNRRRGWNQETQQRKELKSFHADKCADFGGGNGTLKVWLGRLSASGGRVSCP